MKALISKSICKGDINAICSKSILHRMIILASLANGKSIIDNITLSDDIWATINGCTAFGAKIDIVDDRLEIEGIGYKTGSKVDVIKDINVNESASTLRFLIPLFSIFSTCTIFRCSNSLLRRPMQTYIDLFNDGLVRLNDGYQINSNIEAGEFNIRVNESSQFVSGLLLALPFVNGNSKITLIDDVVSSPYIMLTLDALQKFAIKFERNENVITIYGNQELSAKLISIEGDYSNAAFLLALDAIGSDICIEGLNPTSLQGDRIIMEYLNMYLEKHELYCDLKDCPDLAPILFVLAGMSPKKSIFLNTSRLALKESNRLYAMKEELSKANIKMDIHENSVEIVGTEDISFSGDLSTHNDHRICMALTILAMQSKNSVTINNIECVNKSYPNFFSDLISLGAKINIL